MKSDEKAVSSRAEGNKLYGDKKFFEALLKYNESLCFATLGSENLGLAYANRSAVYFEMKLFGNSLKNIALARDFHYPQEKMETLTQRKTKCQEMAKQQMQLINPWNFFKLSYKANRKLRYAVDCLEFRSNEKYGKHIVTNRNLKVGDVLVIEKPFCSVLLSESRFVEIDRTNKFQRCAECLKDNQLDLIPCDSCCDVMFCSSECSRKAHTKYHKYECLVMLQLLKSGSVNIALRIFFIALSAFEGSIENLENFMIENEKNISTVFDFDFSDENNDENVKNYLKCLNSLSRSTKTFSLQAHADILTSHPVLDATWKSHEDFIRRFLQTQCQINDLYFHGIFSGHLKRNISADPSSIFRDLQQSIGSGWFPFCSLINHSCAPNVERIYVEGKVVLVACRPITAGSQLFDCYKANFNKQSKPERQTRLLKEFNFLCDCEACERNFPCPPNLPFKDIKVLKVAKKIEENIFASNGVKKYRDCCDLIESSHNNFPCLEISLLQKCMALMLLINARPSCRFS